MIGARVRLVFLGTPQFAAQGLTALLGDSRYEVAAVVTQPDRRAGRGKELQLSPVKEVALAHAIPILQPSSIRKEGEQFLTSLRALGPFDIGVVIAFGQILPKAMLTLPRLGCVNVHASLLPRWRGAAPIQRAIMAGDTETGICLMAMEEGLDTGPVFSQKKVSITSSENFGTLHDKLAKCGSVLLQQELAKIVQGELSPTPQPGEHVTYASKIENEEAHIRWTEPAEKLARMVRALSPTPGAFTVFQGKRLKIFDARPGAALAEEMHPGSIARSGSSLDIACGLGTTLSLTELQLEGKKRLPVAEFLKGVALPVTEVLQ